MTHSSIRTTTPFDEYVRETILSRYDFGSGSLSIVQDNARTCSTSKNISSKKSQNMNMNKNENASRCPCRWGSPSSVHAINDDDVLQSQNTTNSNTSRSPGRWSNGIADFKGKAEDIDQHLSPTSITSVTKNLTAALAKDPSIYSQITSHADIIRSTPKDHTGRWSNGIADFKRKAEDIDQHLFVSSTTSVTKNLTATLAKEISLSNDDIIGSLPRDHTGLRLYSSLNTITITDPRHGLIRPQRIPSYDYLNCRRNRQGLPKNGGQNFRWSVKV